jgi:selenocysteine-specific elongation factor
MARYVILGTAGHIDHGKSSLVKALTGTDPDRLKEEKERGITIELGFADLAFDDGLTIGIVDVPGHERLVRNMLAGAGGIDIVAMVIAADEGVMPQSREHLAICDLLGIGRGLVVLTKTDMVDADWLELVKDDVRAFIAGTFLEGAPIVAVSSKTGENLDALRETIHRMALETTVKSERGVFRLPIDRVFTLKGFGTVVTGTATGGKISVDETVEILPRGITCKVRGLHSHGKPIRMARAGQRVAVNLQGIEKDELVRGDTLVSPGRLESTTVIDARVRLLKDAPQLKTMSPVHFHTGTAETVGRIVLYDTEVLRPGEEAFCKFRIDNPVVAMSGDRFVIRRFSPLQTLGGGVVLDPSPRRRRRADGIADIEVYASGDLARALETKIGREGIHGMTAARLEGWIKADVPEIAAAVQSLRKGGAVLPVEDAFIHSTAVAAFREKVLARLREFHRANPLKPGMAKEELRGMFPGLPARIFGGLLALTREVAVEQELVRSAGHKVELTEIDEATRTRVLGKLAEGGFQPLLLKELADELKIPEKRVADIFKLLATEGRLKRITDAVYITKERYDEMIALLRKFQAAKPEMTVAEFRDLIGTTRKFALPFLEHLDSSRVTMRIGEARKIILKPAGSEHA